MKLPWRLRCGRPLERGVVAALTFVGVAVACGPEFPNRYYTLTDAELLAAPEGYFAAEVARLLPAAAPLHRAVQTPGDPGRAQMVEVDIAEAKRALAEAGFAQPAFLVADYEQTRRELEKWVGELYDGHGERVRGEVRLPPELRLPAELPAEFRLYLTGAVAWHQRHLDDARRAWQAVLDLPENRRSFRTVWASYMLGRLAVEEVEKTSRYDREPFERALQEVRRRMRATREFVAEGFSDPLGLAVASLGWEGRAALAAGDFPQAIDLYLAQYKAGDASALVSLQRTARAAVNAGDSSVVYGTLARHEAGRRVVTAYLVARGAPRYGESGPNVDQLKAWAVALEQAQLNAAPDADRLAWLAYEAGLFALAERWALLAPADSAETQWIRAKLALRRGNLRGAAEMLRTALGTGKLGDMHRREVLAELSRVYLAQDDFKAALAAAVEGEHWEDAAFVAERVMSLRELEAFVNSQPDVRAARKPQGEDGGRVEQAGTDLRHLLARRLARAGKSEEAENYFPPQWREMFHAYTADVRTGFEAARPTTERAQAFWRAAVVVREHGIALLGTELDPDWAIWEGAYSDKPAAALRREGPRNTGGALAPTSVELQRLEEQRVPEQRFHYRYRAAELAWWAASLLPNDSDETARILNTAGGWLKARDPKAAQRFYEALVIRCGNTALGRAAAQAHWFPKENTAL